MQPSAPIRSQQGTGTAQHLAMVAALIFAAGFIVTLFQDTVLAPLGPLPGSLFSALALMLVVVPGVYFLVARPLLHGGVVPGEFKESITDPLTRTLNRRGITIGLLDLMAMADRYDHDLSVAMVNVDHLGQINREYGSAGGDSVLSTVAALLAEALRMPDRVGRYRDNEFLLVFPETNLSAACMLAERIRAKTAETGIDVDDSTINITISIGVTSFRKGEDLEHLVSRAESAIRQAKDQGRNSVVCTEA